MVSAYFCFTASSSAVEQAFSQLDRCHLQKGRRRVGHQTFRRSLQVLSFKGDEQELKSIIRDAYLLFSSGRKWSSKGKQQGRQVRLDKGIVGKEKNVPSEAAWLRKRKQSLQGAVRDANPSAGSAPVENHDLPEKKQEACQRLAKASMKRRVEADEDGYLLPSEVPPKKKDESTGKKWRKTIRNGKNKHPRLLFMMKWSPSKWTFLVSKGASLDLCFGFRHPQSMKNKQPSILGPTASN